MWSVSTRRSGRGQRVCAHSHTGRPARAGAVSAVPLPWVVGAVRCVGERRHRGEGSGCRWGFAGVAVASEPPRSRAAPSSLQAPAPRHPVQRISPLSSTWSLGVSPRERATAMDAWWFFDCDRGLYAADCLTAAEVAHDPVQPPFMPVERPSRHLLLVAVAELVKRAGRSASEREEARVVEQRRHFVSVIDSKRLQGQPLCPENRRERPVVEHAHRGSLWPTAHPRAGNAPRLDAP